MRAAYGVSWLYVFYDVAKAAKYSHYTRQDSPQQTALVAVKRTVFQSLASMALPAFTIHSTVKIATKLLANSKLRRWGPTVAGMAVVPALPYLFDHPVEHVVDRVFDDYIEPALLGEENSKKSN